MRAAWSHKLPEKKTAGLDLPRAASQKLLRNLGLTPTLCDPSFSFEPIVVMATVLAAT
jgi:hypothetical protein